ncbi:27768_t:CDS:2, partial [Gigaspora margarita]
NGVQNTQTNTLAPAKFFLKHALVHIANTNHEAPLAVITNEFNLQLGTTLTNRTTRPWLRLENCVACKKPFLNEKKVWERKKWCREHLKWTIEWQIVVFFDESRFCLHKSDGRTRTWSRVNEKYHKDCINPTVKFERLDLAVRNKRPMPEK